MIMDDFIEHDDSDADVHALLTTLGDELSVFGTRDV